MNKDINAELNFRVRKNSIMLLIGFLTLVVLFSFLAGSLFYNDISEDISKTEQSYAIEEVFLTGEAADDQEIYVNDGTGEENAHITVTPDPNNIRFRDALLPCINRF